MNVRCLCVVFGVLLTSGSAGAQLAEAIDAFRADPLADTELLVQRDKFECVVMEPPGGYRGLSNERLWPGGIVPYAFDANVNSLNRSRTLAAMNDIELASNVLFVPRTNEIDYVYIISSNVNTSFVGRIGGSQELNMVSWAYRGILLHELMHALSLWHEQQRPDRDQFVEILFENIQSGTAGNFTKRFSTIIGLYDFNSVMHYRSTAFSACIGCLTIKMRPGFEQYQNIIGSANNLSEGDINALVQLYGGGIALNVRTSTFFSRIGDALQVASPQDVIRSNRLGFLQATQLEVPPQIKLRTLTRLTQSPGAQWTLRHGTTLEALTLFGIDMHGDTIVAPGEWATLRGLNVNFADSSSMSLGPGATATIHAAQVALSGTQIFENDSALFLRSQTVVASAQSTLTLGANSTVINDAHSHFETSGSIELRDSALFFSNSDTQFLSGSTLAVPANAQAQISAPSISFAGDVNVMPGAGLWLDAPFVSLGGDWALQSDAQLVLRLPPLAAAMPGVALDTSIDSRVPLDIRLSESTTTQSIDTSVRAIELSPVGRDLRTLAEAPQLAITVAADDMNGDGYDDVVINDFPSRGFRILTSQGPPNSFFNIAIVIPGSVRIASEIELADCNTDGSMDVVVASAQRGKLVLYAQSTSVPLMFTEHIIDTAASGLSALQLIDYDRDGDIDIIASLRTTSEVVLYEQLGISTLTFAKHILSDAVSSPTDIAVADLDRDGDLDVVVCSPTSDSIFILRNITPATFTFAIETLSSSARQAQAIVAGDLNGDRVPEIVAGNTELHIYWPDPFSTTYTRETIDSFLSSTGVIVIEDFNLDGAPDIALARLAGSTVVKYNQVPQPAISSPLWSKNTIQFIRTGIRDLALGDTNIDLFPDFITVIPSPGGIFSIESSVSGFVLEPRSSIKSSSPLQLTQVIRMNDADIQSPETTFARPAFVHGDIQGNLTTSSVLVLTGPSTIGGNFSLLAQAALNLRNHTLRIGGNMSLPNGIETHIKSKNGELILAGQSSTLTAYMPDAGPTDKPAGLNGSFEPIGTLRITGTTTLVQPADAPTATGFALYTEHLIVESGATFNTNGFPVYTKQKTILGTVDDPGLVLTRAPCISDLTGDGATNGADLGLLLGNWGTAGASDLNGDGTTDGADLVLLLGSWGLCVGGL